MNRVERLEKALEVAMQLLREYPHIAERVEALLNPPPAYEDVEVVRWECRQCGHVHKSKDAPKICNGAMGDGWCNGRECFTQLTGTIKRPVPAPVEKMTHGIAADGSVVLDIGEQPPKGTPCVVLWEEGGESAAKPTTKSVSVDGATVNSKGYVTIEHSQIAFFTRPECHGKRGTLAFTWSEEDQ